MTWMKRLLFVVIAIAMTASVAAAQSLAEVAKKEKKRREENTSTSKKVITDRELTRSYGGLPTSRAATSQTGDQEAEGQAASGETEDEAGGEQQDETKTPEYWQGRVSAAKAKIKQLEDQLNEDDWGEGQAVGVDPRGANNLGRRQKAEQDLAAARSELEAIRAEARRANVPPGWVR